MSKRKAVPIGTKFGNLEVVSEGYSHRQRMACDCRCLLCGSVGRRLLKDLFAGKTKSCGCKLTPVVTSEDGMRTKLCSKCEQVKPIEEFPRQRKRYANICKTCMHTYLRQYRRSRRQQWVERKIQLLQDLGVTSCSRCSENHIVCLDFHHPGEKTESISVMMKRLVAYPRILEEAKKCIVLCSNCHRKEHHPEAAVVTIVQGKL